MSTPFIYTGSSWAANSYPIDHTTTNLAKQWGYDYIDRSGVRTGNHKCYQIIKNLNSNLPIVWLYCEPILSLQPATGLSMDNFITSTYWKEIWNKCNQYCIDLICSLPNPIFLIGSGSDIINFPTSQSNITVVPSWQKWLAGNAGLTVTDTIYVTPKDGGNFTLDHCWGAEIVHRYIHENTNIKPAVSLVDAVWDVYYFWQYLEEQQWFFEVHPNRKGNVTFAEFLKPQIEEFLNNCN